jgi:hypothetical protein
MSDLWPSPCRGILLKTAVWAAVGAHPPDAPLAES